LRAAMVCVVIVKSMISHLGLHAIPNSGMLAELSRTYLSDYEYRT
jgi:hypothetical protein